MSKKHDRQQRYQNSLEAKGLKNIRIIIPARREDYLREWASEERDELRREQMVNDIPCVDDPRDDPNFKE